MKKWFVITCLSYLLIPMFVAPLFAQRQGDELGRMAIPCLCCLDIQIPIMPWWMAIPILLAFVIFFVLVAMDHDKQEKLLKQRQEQTVQTYGNWVQRRVAFQADGRTHLGVVVSQDMDSLSINYVDEAGHFRTTKKRINEVHPD